MFKKLRFDGFNIKAFKGLALGQLKGMIIIRNKYINKLQIDNKEKEWLLRNSKERIKKIIRELEHIMDHPYSTTSNIIKK